MSQETAQWLNTRTLIGHTDKRGNAWHYRADAQGAESNHYTGSIPVADVQRRLFNWAAVEGDVTSSYLTVEGVHTITDPTRKAIIRPAGTLSPDDQGGILGLFKSGFQIHDYSQWLIDNVSNILDDGLDIGSAGLLKAGAVAWVQCEVPETITTAEGVAFRPFITATTSLDGSLASTYQTGAQVVVCDNTLSAALAERGGNRIKIKHSRKSLGRIGEVRDALGIVHAVSEEFSAQVAALCAETVTDRQWSAFLDAHAPVSVKGEAKTGRSLTMAETEREQLTQLWNNDNRVSPWRGTAFGVVQAVNTYTHHVQNVRGATRSERNMLRMATGGADALDQGTLDMLRGVLTAV